MSKRWKGDEGHQLPALQREPYRLWFEFLKLAAKDRTVRIDKSIYKQWGDFQEQRFDEWWPAHWKSLFSTAVGVRIASGADAKGPTKATLVLVVPLQQSIPQSVAQIRMILTTHGAGTKLALMPDGQFSLSVGRDRLGNGIHPSTRFLRNLDKVRLLLNIYRFWLQHQELGERKRLEETAKSYFEWASAWNRKVKERKWKRDQIEIPFALAEYVKFLDKKAGRRKVRLYDLNETDIPNHRRQIKRYIRKACRISSNVGRGEFPGSYDQ